MNARSTTGILHVINGEFYSGAERVQDLLAQCLPEYGYEVGFACIKPGRFPAQRSAKGARLHLVPMQSRWDLLCAFRLAQLARREGYRLIHTHTPRAALVGRIAAGLTGLPMVHHVHSPTARDTEGRWRNEINTRVEGASVGGAKRLLPVSESLRRHLIERGIAADRLRVVPNGVRTPGPLPQRETPTAPWQIGCIALFRPRKGLEVLIDALAALRERGRPVRLLAVGPFETPDYQQTILAQTERLGVAAMIDWVGFTSDVDAQLARMDVLVLPSLYGEGMPMVVLEAMASGVPVVASAVEGVPELLASPPCGMLVAPGDVGALESALDDLIAQKNDWQALRQAAFSKQKARYSDQSMARAVAAVYDEVLQA